MNNSNTRNRRHPAFAIRPLAAFMLGALSLNAVKVGAQDTAKELPTVSVQADADKPDGYRATATRVGKVLQDPHDIPQAITTLTGALLEEQQVGSLKEALRNVSGLSFNAAEGGPQRRQHEPARLLHLWRHVSRRHSRHRAIQPRDLQLRSDRRAARRRRHALRPRPGRVA
jgi:outer membrane receptor for monomeric catechols